MRNVANRTATRPCLIVVGIAVPLVLCIAIPVAHAAPPVPNESWSPEVTDALGLYRSGDYAGAQRLAADQMAGLRDPQARRDAAALYALTLLRSPTRTDREDGRARLAQLSREDAALPGRPECALALGIGLTALAETGKALACLDHAAQGFAAAQQPDREAEALAALAEAWSRHTEWEMTPTSFHVAVPAGPEQARQVRREQMQRVRDQLAPLPGSQNALARVDGLLAQDYMDAGDRTADGVRLLEGVMQRTKPGDLSVPAAGQAALKLAEYYESQQRESDALALYERLAAEGSGDAQQVAKRYVAGVTRPEIQLDVPASVRAGLSVRIDLRVRNVPAVQIEVRQVDLGAYLTARKGNLIEASLPETGSVQLARRLDTSVAQEHALWLSTQSPEPLEFHADPGAYVVIASPAGARADVRPAKKLIVISDLTAATVVGPQRVVVWATPGELLRAAGGTVRFWMQGSFVPTEATLADGLAGFAVPPEARVLRDKRWICLVQAGDHLALCRGDMTQGMARRRPAVALVGGPPEPRPGQTLTLAGLVLAPGDAATGGQTSAWRLEVRDTLERVLFQAPFTPAPSGVFAVAVPVARDWDDTHLRVIVRHGDQVAEIARGRFGLKVAPADAHELVVDCRVPPWLLPPVGDVRVVIGAWYPWGTPLTGGELDVVSRAVGLPDPDAATEMRTTTPLEQHADIDSQGRAHAAVPMATWKLSEKAQALWVQSRVFGWEGQQAFDVGEVLVSADPVFGWLSWDPPQPAAGEDTRFELGWFDPARKCGIEPPRLEIARSGAPVVHRALHPEADGLHSDPWLPAADGEFTATAILPRPNDEPARFSRSVHVAPGAPRKLDQHGLECSAWLSESAGSAGVRVRLVGTVASPSAIVVATDDPLVAREVERVAGQEDVFVPGENIPDGARVWLLSAGASGVVVLASAAVAPAPEQTLALRISSSAERVLPGSTVAVHVDGTRSGQPALDTAVIARLVPAADSGYIRWLPGESRAALGPPARGPSVQSSYTLTTQPSVDAPPDGTPAERTPLSPRLVEGLYAGATLWADMQSIGAAGADLHVRIPDAPLQYRLVVLAVAADGDTAVENVLLDARDGVHVAVDVPSRLVLGDRVDAAVRIESGHAQPTDVRLRLDPGPGLHVDSLRVDGKPLPESPETLAAGIPLTVPPNDRRWIQFRVEGAQAGSGTLRASVDLAAGQQTAEAEYQVAAPADVNPGGAPLRIRRTLLKLTREIVTVDPITGDLREDGVHRPVWQRWVFAPGEHLRPSERLLVRDEFVLAAPLSTVTWSQALPPNCHAMLTDSQSKSAVGELKSRQLNTLLYRCPSLAARPQIHEFDVVAVRPGVGVLPPPQITVGGRAVPVLIEPAEIRLSVDEP